MNSKVLAALYTVFGLTTVGLVVWGLVHFMPFEMFATTMLAAIGVSLIWGLVETVSDDIETGRIRRQNPDGEWR